MSLRGYAKERPLVLGQHTAVSIAKESGVWEKIPLLDKNFGMLPPSIMVVGDRRRVISASKLLSESFLLHEEVAKLVGPSGSGRVNVAVGIFEHAGKPLPVTILETQMGCSAQDINAWEILVNSREDGYTVHGQEVEAKGISVIRAGTCGGIIISEDGKTQKAEPFVEIGDVVNAQYSIGDGAVVRQRLGCGSALDPLDIAKFRIMWHNMNEMSGKQPFTSDGIWPKVYSSDAIVEALSASCSELGLICHLGGNFTKESLYLESDEEWVRGLRTKYGALSTEMEHFGLAFLTMLLNKAGIPASNGLISCVVGTVPGGSFAMPGSKEEAKAKVSEERMLEAALRSLWRAVYT
jgi:hypothetical protein